MTDQQLTPKQVALALGVSEASLKRWCDRGLLESRRTGGGHRRLPLQSVLKFLRERGQPLVRPELLGLPSETGTGDLGLDRALANSVECLAQGDEFLFRKACMNLYMSRNNACTIFDRVIAPAFSALGQRWEHGELQVYEERRACEITLRLLRELRDLIPTLPENAPKAIGATLTGNHYNLAACMAEITLREAGWNAQFLGTDLPPETLIHAFKKERPRLCWLSVSYIPDNFDFNAAFNQLYEAAHPLGIPLVLGGSRITPEMRRDLPCAAVCDSFLNLSTFASTLSQRPLV